MTAPLLIAGVQVREQRVAEIEERLAGSARTRRVSSDQASSARRSAVSRRGRSRTGRAASAALKAGSEMRGLLDMLESSHQGLARVPAEGHRSPVERDGDAVEAIGTAATVGGPVAGAQDTNGPIRERASVNDRPLTTREVAEYLGFSLETVLVSRRRARGSGWRRTCCGSASPRLRLGSRADRQRVARPSRDRR